MFFKVLSFELFIGDYLWAKILYRNIIKYFGAIFKFLYWNFIHHYWPNSES